MQIAPPARTPWDNYGNGIRE